MKKLILFLILVSIALVTVACTNTVDPDGDPIEFSPTQKSGDIAAFSLVSPQADAVFTAVPTFKWDSAPNADSYILEICTSTEFQMKTQEGNETIKQIYLKKTGLMNNEFELTANLKKNTKYYWRVTAVNANRKQTSCEVFSFTYNAIEVDEVAVSVGYADEWTVHEAGSKATVTRDQNDFFRNEKDALRVSFDSEDTQRGEEYVTYNGWVVVSRSLEMEFYGIDAFYFRFYYAGNDAKAYFRVVDEDNDYWYSEIKISKNARQSVIIPLDEFIHRTEGVSIGNGEFDYNYLKTVELVFEKVDGDGVAYFGDFRAVKYENFKDMFIDEMDFTDPAYSHSFENYNFGLTETENSVTMAFSGQANEQNAKGMQGYGILRYQIGKMIVSGDAFEFTLSLTNVQNFRNSNFVFRIIEEDNDRWIYSIKISDVPEDGKILLPFTAFTLHEYKGDGLRQFGYIKEFQFGIDKNYSGGAITITDLKLVSLSKVPDLDIYTVKVGKDGLIDNFESYTPGYKVLYKWDLSAVNKDEAIEVYSETALGAKNHAAKMGYKTDLDAARYRVNFTAVNGYNAISIDAKDLSYDSADATMIVYLHTAIDELYSYTITKLADDWKTYTIPIAAFSLDAKSSGRGTITIERVTGVSIAFQYFYRNAKYNSGNYVCVDNVKFINAENLSEEHSVTEVEVSGKVKMSATNNKIAVISAFDSEDEDVVWEVNQGSISSGDMAPNSAATLSNQTASGQGGSLKLDYKSKMVAPFAASMVVDKSVSVKGVSFLMKGDGKSPYVEVILYAGGKSYVCKNNTIEDGWNVYSIGFSNFTTNDGNSTAFTAENVDTITGIAIYVKNNNGNYVASSIYLDEIYFDNSIQLTTKTTTAYAA